MAAISIQDVLLVIYSRNIFFKECKGFFCSFSPPDGNHRNVVQSLFLTLSRFQLLTVLVFRLGEDHLNKNSLLMAPKSRALSNQTATGQCLSGVQPWFWSSTSPLTYISYSTYSTYITNDARTDDRLGQNYSEGLEFVSLTLFDPTSNPSQSQGRLISNYISVQYKLHLKIDQFGRNSVHKTGKRKTYKWISVYLSTLTIH